MEFFVRPAGKKYGKGDGSTYKNAFSGFDAIKWDNVRPGDVIYVAGEHKPPKGKSSAPIAIKRSGKKNEHIVICGYKDDPAVFIKHYTAMDGQSYITLRDFTMKDSGQVRGEGSTNIRLKNMTLSRLNPANIIFVELRAGNHDWSVEGGKIEYCGNGVYARIVDSDGNPAQRLTVRGVKFRHMATGKWVHKDGHAVGIQGGNGHRIIENDIDDVGTAICCWGPAQVEMRDLSIKDNRIKNCRALKVSMGSGIEISGSIEKENDLPKVGWRSGSEIIGNIVDKCAGYGISANIRDALVEKNNKVTNAKKGARRIRNPFAS